jgi:hypothetical protein
MIPRMFSMGTITSATSAMAPSGSSSGSSSGNPLLPRGPSLRAARSEYELARDWNEQAFTTGLLAGAAGIAVVIGGAYALSSLKRAS